MRRLTAASATCPPLERWRHWRLKAGALAPFADLVGFYCEANRRYGVVWSYLVALYLVETKFDSVKSDSVAGAKGPM